MGNLCASDVHRLISACAQLYTWQGTSEEGSFAQHTVRILPQLVDAAVVAYQSFDFTFHTTELVLSDRQADIDRHAPAFYQHLDQHPLVSHVRATGSSLPLRITDITPFSDFENTDLFQQFYRNVGLGHQLAASLPAARGDVIGLVYSRDLGDPDFSDRDREMLELFRIHVLQAQQIARELAALRTRLQRAHDMLEAVDEGVIALDPALSVRESSERAAAILEKHFGKPRARQLPDELAAWVRAQLAHPASPSSAALPLQSPRFAAILDTAAGYLRIQLARRGGDWLLVLEEPLPPTARTMPEHLKRKLTPRELEVLQWICAGKSNPEIGIILHASPRTVQKHVEHILAKLNVENRQAAALRAMEF